jgi:hypothetical protein
MERPKHVTIWRPEFRGTPIIEWTIQPKNAVKAALIGVGISMAVLGSKALVDYLDDTMRVQYVVNGSSAPSMPDEPQVWNRPTDWKHK